VVGAEDRDAVARARQPDGEALDVELRTAALGVRQVAPVEQQDVAAAADGLGAAAGGGNEGIRWGNVLARDRGAQRGAQGVSFP
jgi:hypothetical protein